MLILSILYHSVFFNSDWGKLKYFVSSKETVFTQTFLKKVDAEILIGQNSFLQLADMYNYIHAVDVHVHSR